jgi:hypothetical protein
LKVALNTIKQTNKTSVESGIKHHQQTNKTLSVESGVKTDNVLFVCLMVFNTIFNR